MPTPIVAASLLWTVWMISWIVAAIWSSRAVVHQSGGHRLLQLVLFGVGCTLLFGHPNSPLIPRYPLFPLPSWTPWTAVGFVVTGFVYAWWARIHLGRLWSGSVTLKAEHMLIRSGPYQLTRHPIYTGLTLALLATALLQNEPAALAGFAIILAALLIKIRQEERLLTNHFGALYERYRTEVPALIPKPWRVRE